MRINAQETIDALLKKYTDQSVPYIHAETLDTIKDSITLLDAREQEEYNVSHLKNAIYVGYTHFTMETVIAKKIAKDSPIVVYCSLGVRSEDIAEELQKAGYTNVSNLYGGIFKWKNESFPVIDSTGTPTENVHAYDKTWGKWLKKGKKVY